MADKVKIGVTYPHVLHRGRTLCSDMVYSTRCASMTSLKNTKEGPLGEEMVWSHGRCQDVRHWLKKTVL